MCGIGVSEDARATSLPRNVEDMPPISDGWPVEEDEREAWQRVLEETPPLFTKVDDDGDIPVPLTLLQAVHDLLRDGGDVEAFLENSGDDYLAMDVIGMEEPAGADPVWVIERFADALFVSETSGGELTGRSVTFEYRPVKVP